MDRKEKALREYNEMETSRLSHAPGVYSVRHGEREHTVNLDSRTCSCPDHKTRQVKCKHIWRVELELGESAGQGSGTGFRKYDWKPDGFVWF